MLVGVGVGLGRRFERGEEHMETPFPIIGIPSPFLQTQQACCSSKLMSGVVAERAWEACSPMMLLH